MELSLAPQSAKNTEEQNGNETTRSEEMEKDHSLTTSSALM